MSPNFMRFISLISLTSKQRIKRLLLHERKDVSAPVPHNIHCIMQDHHASKICMLPSTIKKFAILIWDDYHKLQFSCDIQGWNIKNSINFIHLFMTNDLFWQKTPKRWRMSMIFFTAPKKWSCKIAPQNIETTDCGLYQGFQQLRAWVSAKWSPINSFFLH